MLTGWHLHHYGDNTNDNYSNNDIHINIFLFFGQGAFIVYAVGMCLGALALAIENRMLKTGSQLQLTTQRIRAHIPKLRR